MYYLRVRDPGYLSSETFYMGFLLLQLCLGYKHREGVVLYAHLLDLLVEPRYNAILPYGPRCWLVEISRGFDRYIGCRIPTFRM